MIGDRTWISLEGAERRYHRPRRWMVCGWQAVGGKEKRGESICSASPMHSFVMPPSLSSNVSTGNPYLRLRKRLETYGFRSQNFDGELLFIIIKTWGSSASAASSDRTVQDCRMVPWREASRSQRLTDAISGSHLQYRNAQTTTT